MEGEAKNNGIIIEGGAVEGVITGVFFRDEGQAENNSVTLKGSINLNGAALYGYQTKDVDDVITSSGTALNLDKLVQTGKLNSVQNFDQYNFVIERGKVVSSGVTPDFALTAATVAMNGATVGTIEITGGARLNAGDTVGLISADSLTDYAKATDTNAKGLQGSSLVYEFDVMFDDNKLYAAVISSESNPTVKSFAEGYLAGSEFLNRGADLIEKEAVREAALQTYREQGPAVFAAMGYSDARHNTGSHVDVKGPSLLVGIGPRQRDRQRLPPYLGRLHRSRLGQLRQLQQL